MKTPFAILEVDESADDAAIKSAYLKKVKQFPPEQAPREFQQVREAFELVRDAHRREEYTLFHCPLPDKDDWLEKLLIHTQPRRPDPTMFADVMAHHLTKHKCPLE